MLINNTEANAANELEQRERKQLLNWITRKLQKLHLVKLRTLKSLIDFIM